MYYAKISNIFYVFLLRFYQRKWYKYDYVELKH